MSTNSRKKKRNAPNNFSAKTRRFRFQRKIDLKRSTSATGIVERIEYDPNRTARIALIRWEGEALQRKSNAAEDFAPPAKSLEATAAAGGSFAFSSLPGLVNYRSAAYLSNRGEEQSVKSKYLTVGVPKSKSCFTTGGVDRKKTSVKDVFVSAFSTKAMGQNAGSSIGFPRMAVAGSRPAFFVMGEGEEVGGKDTFTLGEVQKWKKDSPRWMNRIKRKGAVSWNGLRGQEKLGLKGLAPKSSGKVKNTKLVDDHVPVTYMIASHKMKKGDLVMNWSESSDSNQYSYT